MISLLLNKKTAVIFSLVLPLILTSYAKATLDASFDGIEIRNLKPNYIYNRGNTFYAKCYLKNTGTEYIPSYSYIVRIYAGDYNIGSINGPKIPVNGEINDWSFMCTIPNNIPYGFYNIWGKIFMDGDLNSNNDTTYYSPDIIITPPYPSTPGTDLWILSINAINNICNPGGEIKFETVIINLGSVTSDNYVVNFSLGSNYLGSISCEPLGPGEVFSINETEPFSIPSGIPVGYYVASAAIVCPNESITNNNIGHPDDQIRVAAPNIDISVTNVTAGGNNYKPGDLLPIQTTLKNIGTSTAENIAVEYYIGENLIGISSRSNLDPEQTETFDTQFQIPNNLPDGYYTVKAVASCTNEVNLGNNEMSSSNNFWVGRKADPVVQSVNAVNGTYMPRDSLTIYSLVKNIGDGVSRTYTVDFYLSLDNVITATDLNIGHVKRDALDPNEQHSYNTTFKLPPNIPAANYYVGIKVTCNEDNNLANNSGYDNELVSIIHLPNYVCGRVKYTFPEFSDQPVRYALLKIIDSGSDRVIAQTYTDENGNYGEVVLRDGLSSANIYIKIYAGSVSGAYPGTMSKICIVRDDINHGWFSQKSSAYPHPQNSSRIINYTTSSRAFMVFDSMVEAFIQAKEFFGIEIEEIASYWPSSDNGTYYDPTEGIFIKRDDEWDRDIILHEYGHLIAELYDFAQGEVGTNGTHTWDADLRSFPVTRTAKQASNLGFREAWPTLFSIASQLNDNAYPNSGDTKYQDFYSGYQYTYQLDLEMDTFANRSPGECYDNMNCCLLWDIFDDNPDHPSNFNEMVTDPNLYRIWTIMRSYKPEDMNDFWIGWNHRFAQDSDMPGVINIFKKHRMTFAESGQPPVLPQNHAPVAFAGPDMVVTQNRPEGAMVHLDGSGSADSDGDSLSYIWRRGYIKYTGAQLDIVLPVGKTALELEVSDGKIATWDTVVVTVTPTSP